MFYCESLTVLSRGGSISAHRSDMGGFKRWKDKQTRFDAAQKKRKTRVTDGNAFEFMYKM